MLNVSGFPIIVLLVLSTKKGQPVIILLTALFINFTIICFQVKDNLERLFELRLLKLKL